MRGTPWTQDQLDNLAEIYGTMMPIDDIERMLGRGRRSIYTKARALGLQRPKEILVLEGIKHAQRPEAVAHRFSKGHVPQNKGKAMSPEQYAKCSATMFRKGNTPVNHREVGSERVNVDGYYEIKVEEPNKWRPKHRIIWEKANGEIPKGYNIQFRNGNRLDCRLENLYIISRREQMTTENSFYAKYPKELQDVIHLKAAINRQIHKKEKQENNG